MTLKHPREWNLPLLAFVAFAALAIFIQLNRNEPVRSEVQTLQPRITRIEQRLGAVAICKVTDIRHGRLVLRCHPYKHHKGVRPGGGSSQPSGQPPPPGASSGGGTTGTSVDVGPVHVQTPPLPPVCTPVVTAGTCP